MSEVDPEYVKHQYLYLPWTEGVDCFGAGKALAVYVAQHFNARLTVVCPQKSNAEHHKELVKRTIVTERRGLLHG